MYLHLLPRGWGGGVSKLIILYQAYTNINTVWYRSMIQYIRYQMYLLEKSLSKCFVNGSLRRYSLMVLTGGGWAPACFCTRIQTKIWESFKKMGSRERFGVLTSLPRHLNARVPPEESCFKWRPAASYRVLCSFILFVNGKRSDSYSNLSVRLNFRLFCGRNFWYFAF